MTFGALAGDDDLLVCVGSAGERAVWWVVSMDGYRVGPSKYYEGGGVPTKPRAGCVGLGT